MQSAQVTDLYQASFLLLSGCELTEVQCIRTAGSLSCRMSFTGEEVEELIGAWWEKAAVVNLWSFRSAYNQINSYIHQAKKSYQRTLRGESGEVGDECSR